jgi:hypothetical protein
MFNYAPAGPKPPFWPLPERLSAGGDARATKWKLTRPALAQTEGLEEVFEQKKTKGAKNWA